MRKRSKRPGTEKPKAQADSLKTWQQIAAFLGQPISVAQRWARSGMPVTRQGRFVTASPQGLNDWLGRESGGEPVHVATEVNDLAADLRRGLSYARQHRKPHRR